MDPLQVLLIVLAVAGIWAVIELALTVRRARATVENVDKTVGEVNEMLAEARPVVAKLDGAIDDIQPALAQVEPLLKSANVAVDALSADLVEIEGVVRDVSMVTGAAASAGNAVSDVADSASEAVQKILGKIKPGASDAGRSLYAGEEPRPSTEPVPVSAQDASVASESVAKDSYRSSGYYTYGSTDGASQGIDAENQGESANE